MAKFASKAVDITVNSVVLEDDIDNFTLNVEQELPVVTSFADAGPRRLAGNYDWGLNISGKADFAASQSDATIFGTLGSAGVTMSVEPTGSTGDTNTPEYTSTTGLVLESYSISAALGGAVEYSAAFKGTAALTRDVTA